MNSKRGTTKDLGLLAAPRTEEEYDRAVAYLNTLVDEIGDEPANPRYLLIETLSALIEQYDREHYRLPDLRRSRDEAK